MRLSPFLIASTLALAGESHLADIGPAPQIDLIDSRFRPFSMTSLRGKVVLVSFVYTTCNGSCPATTAILGRVRRKLRDEGRWGRTVEFASITLDPIRDTPEALARYARLYRADPDTWHFLTGTPDQVARVLKAWDMWAKVGPSGVLDHPSRIFLIDGRGHRREIYNLETLTPDAVTKDVESLVEEGAGS